MFFVYTVLVIEPTDYILCRLSWLRPYQSID